MRLQEFTISIDYRKGPENIVADFLSNIPWPVVPGEWNSAEDVSAYDLDSECAMNAALCALDVVMPTLDDLPQLTMEEIGVEQRRDDQFIIVHTKPQPLES